MLLVSEEIGLERLSGHGRGRVRGVNTGKVERSRDPLVTHSGQVICVGRFEEVAVSPFRWAERDRGIGSLGIEDEATVEEVRHWASPRVGDGNLDDLLVREGGDDLGIEGHHLNDAFTRPKEGLSDVMGSPTSCIGDSVTPAKAEVLIVFDRGGEFTTAVDEPIGLDNKVRVERSTNEPYPSGILYRLLRGWGRRRVVLIVGEVDARA